MSPKKDEIGISLPKACGLMVEWYDQNFLLTWALLTAHESPGFSSADFRQCFHWSYFKSLISTFLLLYNVWFIMCGGKEFFYK